MKVTPFTYLSFTFAFFLSGCYMLDVIKYNAPDADEYKNFANVILPKADSVNFHWAEKIDTSFNSIHISPMKKDRTNGNCMPLAEYIEKSNTTAFMIIRNDTIIYEKFSKGHGPYYKYPSFSMIKSLGVFPLIGIAIEEGYIKSMDDPITDYFPELKPQKKFKRITIRHLLNMTSGINEYPFPAAPWSNQLRYYYGHHLEKELKKLKIDFPPDKAYRYSVGSNTQLLAFLLERTTGKKIQDYYYEKIWSKIGAESDAYWSMDRADGNVKAFCCFFTSHRDFARLGRLFQKKGNWNGEQIIPLDWINEITASYNVKKKGWRFLRTARRHNSDYYSMHWYVGTKGYNEFKAAGFFGQQICIFPEKNTMIVTFAQRKGFSDPPYQVEIFYQVMDEVEAKYK